MTTKSQTPDDHPKGHGPSRGRSRASADGDADATSLLVAQQRVLARLDAPGPRPGFADLANVLGLRPETEPADQQRLADMLLAMARNHQVVSDRDGRYRRFGPLDVVGRVSMGASRHFALVVPLQRERRPVKVHLADLAGAREGDLVHAVITDDRHPQVAAELDETFGPRRGRRRDRDRGGRGRRGARGRDGGAEASSDDVWYWGRVEQILRKRPRRVIGVYHEPRGRYGPSVKLLQREMSGYVAVAGALPPGTRQGSIVDVEIQRGSDRGGQRGTDTARVLEVLGHVDAPADDELTVIAEYGLRMAYDPAAEAELDELVAAVQREFDEGRAQAEREDLTHLRTYTVDPADARDHDDAISLEPHDDGTMTLGIHIADVSHFVPPGSALDIEARERGCTVYFPARTLHMLPPRLAREVCSLVEGKVKLAKSVLIRIDQHGRTLERRLVRSLVKIDRFLTYAEVLRILLGTHTGEDEVPEHPHPDWLVADIRAMRRAADILHEARRRQGSFLLDIARPKVVLNEAGTTALAVERESSGDASHNLIEEFMLAANRAVASFLLEHRLPYIARVHPPPREEDITEFVGFLARLGYRLDGPFTPRSVQALLDEIAEHEGGEAVHLALLKSMQRARYDAEPGLHYALQFPYYTHFTSPIRRYPDLIAHQILDAYLDHGGAFAWHQGNPVAKPREDWQPPDASRNGHVPEVLRRGIKQPKHQHLGGLPLAVQTQFEMELPTVAFDASEAAMRAEYAESRATLVKILRLIEHHHLDRVLEATVTGTTRHGLFCQVDEFLIEGLVPAWSLDADGMELEGSFGMLLAYGGRVVPVHVGDRVMVRIIRADPAERELELELAQSLARRRERGGGAASTPHAKRGGRRPQKVKLDNLPHSPRNNKKPHRGKGKGKGFRRSGPPGKGRGGRGKGGRR